MLRKLVVRSHELKCWPKSYDDLTLGHKKADLRRDDRGFQVGDEVVMRRWDPNKTSMSDNIASMYSGPTARFRIVHIESCDAWMYEGTPGKVPWVILSLEFVPS